MHIICSVRVGISLRCWSAGFQLTGMVYLKFRRHIRRVRLHRFVFSRFIADVL